MKLEFNVPSNRILKIMGECNPNMEGAKEFIHSLMLNQPIWPNQYGQDVAAAAFFIHEERLKAQQEINRLREEIKKSIPAMRDYARSNPQKHDWNGVLQDPCGVHEWMRRNDEY